MSVLDRATESASRWMAKRTTRRSFLANAGRVAIATAAGSAVTAVFTQQAEARVCGQSGVSPKCPTYDCLAPGFWGYCWYASPGCCSNGGLKKICDCCLTGWPNVQGYCPSGAAVYCVVESCLEDPRVQTVALDRWTATSATTAALQQSVARKQSDVVVFGNAADTLALALAVPVASEFSAPLFPVPPGDIPADVVAEVKRLTPKRIIIASPWTIAPAAVVAIFGESVRVEVLSVDAIAGDIATASVEVGRWLLNETKRPEVIGIGADAEAVTLAPAVGAYARSRRAPIAVGPDAIRALRGEAPEFATTLVGAGMKGAVDRATEFCSGSPVQIALGLADAVIKRDFGLLTAGFTSTQGGAFGITVASNSLVILHDPNAFGSELRDWILERRRRFSRAELCTLAPGALDNGNIYWLQSALNGFDAHQLTGFGGDGLPVYPQTMEERAVGAARVTGPLPSTSTPPGFVRTSRVEDNWPVATVVMPPPTSWPPGTTTTTLPPPSASTTRPGRKTTKKAPTKTAASSPTSSQPPASTK